MNTCRKYISESSKEPEIASISKTNKMGPDSMRLSDKGHLDTEELYYLYRLIFYCIDCNARGVLFPL